MSAILGICSLEEVVDVKNNIGLMMDAIPEFGEDKPAKWVSNQFACAYLKMARTPQAEIEVQPFVDHQTGIVITADIRLDNRSELNQYLGLEDRHDDLSDSIYVLAAYKRWGKDCPKYLIGDYAIAIWDQKQEMLQLITDSSGIKPLYFAETPKGFAFASNINALLVLSFINCDYDQEELAGFLLSRHWTSHEKTYFKGIHKLTQGKALSYSAKGLWQHEYWNIQAYKEIRYANEKEYVSAFRELFFTAIRDRLRTNNKVGSHISGGLDSTPLTIFANDILLEEGRSLTGGYTWSPPPEDGDLVGELDLLDWVNKKKGIPIFYSDLTIEETKEIYSRDITRLPQNTLFSEVNLLRMAKKHGVGVMLSGWGGDEIVTFNGRGHLTELFITLKWGRMLRELSPNDSSVHPRKIYHRIKNDLNKIYGWRFAGNDYLRRTRKFQTQLINADNLPELKIINQKNIKLVPGFRNNQILLWNNGHLAARAVDWHHQGAIYGVEYRYPFLDRRVIEFMMGIPDEMVFRMPWRGYLMRLFAQEVIPKEKAWSQLKKEEYRQPIFQETLREGLGAWISELVVENEFNDFVKGEKLIQYLKTYQVSGHTLEENQRVRRLLQVATLPQR